MTDILDIFENVLSQSRSIDVADSELRRAMCDDPAIRTAYRQWCEEQGTTEKNGFIEYCEQRFDEEEQYWDTLDEEAYEL